MTPVKWWAGLGVAALGFQTYLYARWILSGNLKRTPTGSDPVPTYLRVAAHANEVLAILLALGCVYWFCVRPWRHERRVTIGGLACFAALSVYWQDTAGNWANHIAVWNAEFFNLGAWYNFIPGWVSPQAQHIPEPLLFAPPIFIPFFVSPMAFAWFMRRAKAKWPALGVPGLLFVAFLCGAICDFVIEMLWLLMGLYVYAGTIPSLTIFAGKYYQFPLYEMVLWGLAWGAYGVFFYFVDDKGYTWAERGVDRISASRRQQTVLRLLGVAGFFNLVLAVYTLIFGAISLHPSFRWSNDIVTNRSYLRAELCGVGTSYACPGKDVPIPKQGGSHLGPDGRLVVPDGAEGRRYR